MNVVKLAEWRSPGASSGYDGLTCSACGSSWFELCTIAEDGAKSYGAVCLDATGHVTGYAGTTHCLSCGHEELP